ncbi:MAG TPA: patatin-like phospholipase family protein [Candidatus Nitrosocosmicus sp.]|nr:patatin-like phospholipase family protein [Candidatus Nitrosocosmicus sp.]
MSYQFKDDSHDRHKKSRSTENVLVMQGGGSLGAFACGVYKALVKQNVRIDIVAGTSIGAVNAAIIVGSKSAHPEQDLENFWLEIAESNFQLIPDMFTYDWDVQTGSYIAKKISAASANAAFFGIPKMFIPKWNWWSKRSKYSKYVLKKDQQTSDPRSWTYLYDHSPLGDTLERYIDYKKLNLAAAKEELPSVLRLIITAVDVLTAKPLIFDNTQVEIKTQHILASTGYPIYGFPWVEIDEDLYGWDGSLLSSTPIREVLFVSPRNDKNIIIVENYPKKIDRLPSNMAEVANRYKDILFSDKDQYSIKMSKLLTRHIRLIENLYDIFENFADKSQLDVNKIKSIEKEYKTLIENYGAEIRSITRIVRSEIESPTILKNADFSVGTIKNLIEQGEKKTIEKLKHLDFE